MSKIITHCPSCDGGELMISKIQCLHCQTTFEGRFDIPILDKLSETQLAFIIDFVKCSGSLKEMALKQAVSYPTLRNRLNELIEAISTLASHTPTSEGEILSLLEEGQISALQAANMLKKL